jgi:hypothetical protein
MYVVSELINRAFDLCGRAPLTSEPLANVSAYLLPELFAAVVVQSVQSLCDGVGKGDTTIRREIEDLARRLGMNEKIKL